MDSTIESVIVRRDDVISSEELVRRLQAEPSWDDSVRLKISDPQLDVRAMDPTLVSALCGAGGVVLGAFFGALGNVAQALGKQKIVVRRPNGATVEVDARNALSIVEELLTEVDAKMIISI